MTRAIIAGVERQPIARAPNGIGCDACPAQVNFERYEFSSRTHIRPHFRAKGWLCSEVTNYDLCPKCAGLIWDAITGKPQ